MRTLILHHYAGWGGAGLMTINIIREMHCREIDVVLVCEEGPVAAKVRKEFSGVTVDTSFKINTVSHYKGGEYFFADPRLYISLVKSFFSVRQYISILSRYAPDTVVIMSSTAFIYLIFSKIFKKDLKTSIVIQENISKGLIGGRRLIMQALIRKFSNKIFFISFFDMYNFRTDGKSALMRNWSYELDIKKNCSNIHSRYDFIYLGGMSTLKGVVCFYKALKILESEGIEPRVCIMGDLNFPREYKYKGVQISGIYDYFTRRPNIELIGMKENALEKIAQSRVLVFPIEEPHQGRPIMEAGSVCVSVIAPDFPALGESIVNGYNGLIYKRRDPLELSAAMKYCIFNREVVRKMGIENMKLYRRMHSPVNFGILHEFLMQE